MVVIKTLLVSFRMTRVGTSTPITQLVRLSPILIGSSETKYSSLLSELVYMNELDELTFTSSNPALKVVLSVAVELKKSFPVSSCSVWATIILFPPTI